VGVAIWWFCFRPATKNSKVAAAKYEEDPPAERSYPSTSEKVLDIVEEIPDSDRSYGSVPPTMGDAGACETLQAENVESEPVFPDLHPPLPPSQHDPESPELMRSQNTLEVPRPHPPLAPLPARPPTALWTNGTVVDALDAEALAECQDWASEVMGEDWEMGEFPELPAFPAMGGAGLVDPMGGQLAGSFEDEFEMGEFPLELPEASSTHAPSKGRSAWD